MIIEALHGGIVMKRLVFLLGFLGLFFNGVNSHAATYELPDASGGSAASSSPVGAPLSALSLEELTRVWQLFGERRDPVFLRREMEGVASRIGEVETLDPPMQPVAQNILYALGTMCFKGEGGPVVLEGAFRLYERSGRRGYKKLGLLYDAGLGVLRNSTRALDYYERDRGSLSSAFHRARRLLHEGAREEAIKAYEALLESKPDYTSALLNLSALMRGRDDDQARAYHEQALMKPDSPMSALLIAVFEDAIGPPPMIDYVDPSVHKKEAETFYEEERSRSLEFRGPIPTSFLGTSSQLGDLMEQLLLFTQEEGRSLGSLAYFYHGPYSNFYRPNYSGAEEMDSGVFLGEMIDAHRSDDPKVRVVQEEGGRALLASFFEEPSPLIRKTLSLVKAALEEDPSSFLRSHYGRLETEDPERILRLARALFVDLLIGRLEVFGDSRHPLILWNALDNMLWHMRYHQVQDDQSLGMSMSKLTSRFKRSLLGQSTARDPMERLVENHALYTVLGVRLGLVDMEDLPLLVEMMEDTAVDFKPHVRSLVGGLTREEKDGFIHPSYTVKGLVQLMKCSLFDATDSNVTVRRLSNFALVDEELRGHYYHALFMDPQVTDFFDPYAEDSQKGGGAFDESASLIFGDKTFETIIRRFGYIT